MTRQAQVGAFTLVALLFLFGVFYVITDFGTRSTGYQLGVHFRSAAGVTRGSLVYFSGVEIGSVDDIKLLDDNTVDVILAISHDVDIPQASRFLIQAPLTGSPNVIIVPPAGLRPPFATLDRRVLPVASQPQGTNSATVADLLDAGQGEIKRFDELMAELQARTPKLLSSLQMTINNANDLAVSTKASLQLVSQRLLALSASMETGLSEASANVAQLTSTLNGAASTDSTKVGALLDQLNETSLSLNKSMASIQGLATDPQLKANVLQTTQSIADATQTLAELAKDLRTVTGNPQTQAQLRDTVANLDATLQKANSLLGELGATSSVPGVDAGATPAAPAVPQASPYPGASPGAASSPGPTSSSKPSASQAKMASALSGLTHNLVALELRLSGLSVQQNPGLNPVMTKSQGPLGDINLILLPHASTSLMVGANSIGNNTTWNAVLLKGNNSSTFTFGGGVLYSQIGALARANLTKSFGLETRVYDLTYPMIDLYGNIHILKNGEIFFGQRDITHASRRNTAGFQYTF
jgi:phospholipid/cholesterol/gamma-HCH transport system substrate-binding protein